MYRAALLGKNIHNIFQEFKNYVKEHSKIHQ